MAVTASKLESIAALLSNWLDQECEARFLLDKDLKILWHNRMAADWLGRTDCPLKLSGNVLVAKDGRQQCRFQALFSGGGMSVGTIPVSAPNSDKGILLCARQVGEHGKSPSFGLSVRSTCGNQPHNLIGLGEAFNLTPSEEAVLKKMVSGNTVDRIAQSSKVSPETVRTHVRRAYSKMSVSSREEMFSRIRPFLFGRE